MYTIRFIDAQTTFAVRHPVLRPGMPIESCRFDNDNDPTTKHWGIYLSDQLVGIISLFEKSHPFFEELRQFQIRGMAILPEHQKKGYGELLVKEVEKYISKKEKKARIWLNAREKAVPFYKKTGYHTIGDPFEVNGIGKHFVMTK